MIKRINLLLSSSFYFNTIFIIIVNTPTIRIYNRKNEMCKFIKRNVQIHI